MVRARRAELAGPGGVREREHSYLQQLRSFAAEPLGRVDEAFLEQVGCDVGPDSVVVDVGAGAGRHTVRLARATARVVAVEPNPVLLAMLVRRATAAGVADRVVPVPRMWAACDGVGGDVVVCARVLPRIVDVGPFVHRLARAAATRVHVLLPGAGDAMTLAPRPGPDDVAAVVEEVVGVPCRSRRLGGGPSAATAVSFAGQGQR